jgi:uncharacterized protein (TIGR02996 family)
MSDNLARGFLEDIIAHPDDDAPRLIFADWLEEQGDGARAEFIRSQIERARLPDWDAGQVRLRLREQELLAQHGQKWKEGLPDVKGIVWEGFRRGFVAEATVSNFAVLRGAASTCWAATPLEAVAIPWPRQDESADTIPPLAGLRELSINAGHVDRQEVDRLADAPLLSTLRALNVRGCGLGVEGFHRLTASAHLGNLAALRVPHNSIGNGGIQALFDAPSLRVLAELDLSEAGSYGRYGEDPIIDGSGLGELASWPGLQRLRSLNLSGNHVGRNGLRALLRSPHATGLKALTLRANGLNDLTMEEFGGARTGLRLDVLDLGENLLGDRGAKGLARRRCLRELKVLRLDRCEIAMAGSLCLARAAFLGSLRVLNLNHNNCGPDFLRKLLQTGAPALHTLQMLDNIVCDLGVSHLAGSPGLNTLLELDLGQNALGDKAAQALAKSQHLRGLLVLRLHGNQISLAAESSLTNSPLGKGLAVLEMSQEDEVSG